MFEYYKHTHFIPLFHLFAHSRHNFMSRLGDSLYILSQRFGVYSLILQQVPGMAKESFSRRIVLITSCRAKLSEYWLKVGFVERGRGVGFPSPFLHVAPEFAESRECSSSQSQPAVMTKSSYCYHFTFYFCPHTFYAHAHALGIGHPLFPLLPH